MSIVIIGNTVVDLVFPNLSRLPSWPKHTEFTPANLVFPPEPPIVSLGGNGANAAYAAARCGARVILHTQLGSDALGGLARQWLTNAGCRVESGKGASTAVNVTATNRRHQRATLFYPGADIPMPRTFAGARAPSHLLVCGWPHPSLAAMAAGLHRARRNGIFTTLDAGPILGAPWTLLALRGVFAGLDLFIANEYEARTIARSGSLDEALVRLRRHFKSHVVIKRGAKGALWLPADSDDARPVPAPRVKAISTVGAGDSFNGALLAMLARRATWPAALKAACATAAGVASSPEGILGVQLMH